MRAHILGIQNICSLVFMHFQCLASFYFWKCRWLDSTILKLHPLLRKKQWLLSSHQDLSCAHPTIVPFPHPVVTPNFILLKGAPNIRKVLQLQVIYILVQDQAWGEMSEDSPVISDLRLLGAMCIFQCCKQDYPFLSCWRNFLLVIIPILTARDDPWRS